MVDLAKIEKLIATVAKGTEERVEKIKIWLELGK